MLVATTNAGDAMNRRDQKKQTPDPDASAIVTPPSSCEGDDKPSERTDPEDVELSPADDPLAPFASEAAAVPDGSDVESVSNSAGDIEHVVTSAPEQIDSTSGNKPVI
jgi:hypothetical protein